MSFFEDHLAFRRNASARTIHSYRDALKSYLAFAPGCRRSQRVDRAVGSSHLARS